MHAASAQVDTPTNSTHTPNASMPCAIGHGIASDSNPAVRPISPTIGACDWIAPGFKLCYHPKLPFQVCWIADCDIQVHREFQTYWQSRVYCSEISEMRCRIHHAHCNFHPPSQLDTSTSLDASLPLLCPPAGK